MFKKVLTMFLFVFSFNVMAKDLSENLYHYNAKVNSVYDGDTIRADISLGLGIYKQNQSLRLFGINAPEIRGEFKQEGVISRDYLRYLLQDKELIIETIKDKEGKYGRLIVILWVKGKGDWCKLDTWCNVNEKLVMEGYAKEANY